MVARHFFAGAVLFASICCLAPQARSQDPASVLQDAGEAVFCCEFRAAVHFPGEAFGGAACADNVDPYFCLYFSGAGFLDGGRPGIGPCNEETGRCAVALPFCCEYDLPDSEPFACDSLSPILGNTCSVSGGTAKIGDCDPETARCVPPVLLGVPAPLAP